MMVKSIKSIFGATTGRHYQHKADSPLEALFSFSHTIKNVTDFHTKPADMSRPKKKKKKKLLFFALAHL